MAEDYLNKPMDSDLPSRVARCFVELMANKGICLQDDQQSLIEDFEQALENECSDPSDALLEVDGTHFDLGTGAACFFGETLRREYSGMWCGKLGANSAVNYYTTRIQFGEYWFYPFRWISYRLTNGRESEGTAASCLRAVTPSMRDRVDHKEKRIRAIIDSGGTVIDSEIY